MIEVNVHSDIASAEEGQWMALFGMENAVFSLDTVKRVFAENPTETDFTFDYHCNGGSVTEMFAIYDTIRTSGKNIHSNITGDCHSAAVVLMLAAPAENRRCNPNASSLIHEIRGGVRGTADEMREAADYIDQQTEKMLNIYVDRTGTDRATLEALLKEEKVRTPEELLQYGFISKINPYTTNQMAKKTREELLSLQNKAESFLTSLKNILFPQAEEVPKTFNFNDAEGVLLFTVNREDDQIAIDDVASPDGVYNFEDGRTVTVTDGKITAITEAPAAEPEAVVDVAEVEALRNQVSQLTNSLTEAQALIAEQKEVIVSNYTPSPRVAVVRSTGGQNSAQSKEDIKAAVREKMNNSKTQK